MSGLEGQVDNSVFNNLFDYIRNNYSLDPEKEKVIFGPDMKVSDDFMTYLNLDSQESKSTIIRENLHIYKCFYFYYLIVVAYLGYFLHI